MSKVLWTQKQDIGPRARIGHAMAYDATRRRVVLFGGDGLENVLFGDTWEWDGEHWTQVQDIGPPRRAFHAMAFDTVRRRSVLFGGRDNGGLLGDTWEWDRENWTQVADSGPARRRGHAMAFDRTRQRVVLFGGDSDGRLNDTWEWDGNEWVQRADSGPSPRIHSAMAYDTSRNRLVLFGGAAQDLALGDTWEWDGTAWTQESDFGPPPSAGAAMVHKGSRAALFGGIASIASPVPDPAPAVFSHSWEWNGRHWTAMQDMGPGARVFHAMAFDESRSRVVLFGGSAVPTGNEGVPSGLRSDTWEQFEEGATTGPGIGAVELDPNRATPGASVNVTVVLTSLSPDDEVITISFDGNEIGMLEIPRGQPSGAFQLQVPANQPPGLVMVAARLGASEGSAALEIGVGGSTVDVAAVTAEPNPVTAGQTLVITVIAVTAPPQPANVELLADGQQFAILTIAAGATSGELSFPIETVPQPVEITITARSGNTEASVVLSMQ